RSTERHGDLTRNDICQEVDTVTVRHGLNIDPRHRPKQFSRKMDCSTDTWMANREFSRLLPCERYELLHIRCRHVVANDEDVGVRAHLCNWRQGVDGWIDHNRRVGSES